MAAIKSEFERLTLGGRELVDLKFYLTNPRDVTSEEVRIAIHGILNAAQSAFPTDSFEGEVKRLDLVNREKSREDG